MIDHNSSHRFATPKQIPPIYPAFTEASIRWLLFNKETNGFKQCVRKIGRKVLINLIEFEAWIEAQKGDQKNERS